MQVCQCNVDETVTGWWCTFHQSVCLAVRSQDHASSLNCYAHWYFFNSSPEKSLCNFVLHYYDRHPARCHFIHFDFLVEKLMLPCYCSSSPSQCVRLPPKRQTQECAFRSSSWLVSLFTTLSQHSLHPALICRLVIARRFTCSVFLDAIHSPHIQPRIRLRRINQVLQKNCEVLVIKAIFLFGKWAANRWFYLVLYLRLQRQHLIVGPLPGI